MSPQRGHGGGDDSRAEQGEGGARGDRCHARRRDEGVEAPHPEDEQQWKAEREEGRVRGDPSGRGPRGSVRSDADPHGDILPRGNRTDLVDGPAGVRLGTAVVERAETPCLAVLDRQPRRGQPRCQRAEAVQDIGNRAAVERDVTAQLQAAGMAGLAAAECDPGVADRGGFARTAAIEDERQRVFAAPVDPDQRAPCPCRHPAPPAQLGDRQPPGGDREHDTLGVTGPADRGPVAGIDRHRRSRRLAAPLDGAVSRFQQPRFEGHAPGFALDVATEAHAPPRQDAARPCRLAARGERRSMPWRSGSRVKRQPFPAHRERSPGQARPVGDRRPPLFVRRVEVPLRQLEGVHDASAPPDEFTAGGYVITPGSARRRGRCAWRGGRGSRRRPAPRPQARRRWQR